MTLSEDSLSNEIINNNNNDIINLIDKLNLNCDKNDIEENSIVCKDNFKNPILERLKEKYPSKNKLIEKYHHNKCKPIKRRSDSIPEDEDEKIVKKKVKKYCIQNLLKQKKNLA